MTEQEFTITVAGKEYSLIKKGIAQAQQVTEISKWLAEYGVPIFEKLSSDKGEVSSNMDLFRAILDSLSPQALVDLFAVVIGCTQKVAEKEFDVGVLVDALMIVWENQPGIRGLVNRFFSTQDSESTLVQP